jgi:hypothetical protein
MAATMKIKKGDTVQVLAGKDRGKQGRVIDALPREGRVIVENLNLVKRHRKPTPIRDSSRMAYDIRRHIFDKPSPSTSATCLRVPDLPAGDASACVRRQGRDAPGPLCKRCNEEVDR